MTDRLSGIVDAVRQRLEEELRQQLTTLTAEHERALEEALREAARTSERQAQESEARWSNLLGEARSGAQQMVESAVTAARDGFESERRASQAASAEWTARVNAQLAGAATVTEALNKLAEAVATGTGGALLVSRRGALTTWPLQGGDLMPEGWAAAAAAALQTLEPRSQAGSRAVPVLLDRTGVAVLVSREDAADPGQLEGLALAGAARLATLTATRVVQADRWTGGKGRPVPSELAPRSTDATDR